jgi:hypothetical protein
VLLRNVLFWFTVSTYPPEEKKIIIKLYSGNSSKGSKYDNTPAHKHAGEDRKNRFQFTVYSFWFLVSGFWFLVSGFWFLVSGFCELSSKVNT